MGISVLLAAVLSAAAPSAEEAIGPPQVRAAVEKSLVWIEKEGLDWLDKRKCISCHHGPLLLRTHHEAQLHGFPVDAGKLAAWDERTFKMLLAQSNEFQEKKAGQVESMNMVLGHGRFEDSDSANDVKQEWFKTASRLLANSQKETGAWDYAGQPQKRSNDEAHEATTGWAILALGVAEKVDDTAMSTREKALAWLKQATPGEGNENVVLRILIGRRYGNETQATALVKELLARQNDDGGWSWSKERPSDPFATGQSLYALSDAGAKHDSLAVQRAWKYLLRLQKDDGSWLAPTKKAAGGNAISSFWGSAWATLGLIHSLPD